MRRVALCNQRRIRAGRPPAHVAYFLAASVCFDVAGVVFPIESRVAGIFLPPAFLGIPLIGFIVRIGSKLFFPPLILPRVLAGFPCAKGLIRQMPAPMESPMTMLAFSFHILLREFEFQKDEMVWKMPLKRKKENG
jgi:hypothetical protein